MRKILALAVKDLKLLFRDKAGLFFTFCFPMIVAIFFGLIFSGTSSPERSLRVALVDEDGTEGSRAFAAALRNASELQLVTASLQEGTDLVRRGKCVAYVALPAGFGEARERMFWGGLQMDVGMDPSRRAEAGMLQGILTKYVFEGMQEAYRDPERMRRSLEEARAALKADPEIPPARREALARFFEQLEVVMHDVPAPEGTWQGWQPLTIKTTDVAFKWEGPKSPYDFTFPQGIMWGMLGCASSFGISLVEERTRGTLVRLLIAPAGRAHILAGKALACFVATLVVFLALLVAGRAAFGVRPHSLLLLALAFCCASMAVVGLMMLLSVLGRTERSAGSIGWGIMVMLSMIGGGSIPLFFMPTWLKTLSHVSPVKWIILAYEGALWRGFSFGEMLLPCGILLGVGLVSFAIGVRVFRWMD